MSSCRSELSDRTRQGNCYCLLMLLAFIKFIDDISKLVRCDISLVGFGVDDEHKNTSIIFKLIDDAISATFSLLDVTVFEANLEDSIAYSRDLIADEVSCLKVVN